MYYSLNELFASCEEFLAPANMQHNCNQTKRLMLSAEKCRRLFWWWLPLLCGLPLCPLCLCGSFFLRLGHSVPLWFVCSLKLAGLRKEMYTSLVIAASLLPWLIHA